MKKFVLILLLCFVASNILIGCGKRTSEPAPISQSVAIGNPWSNWTSIEEAENAVGFSFGLPEVIANNFTASAFRTMNNELLEVIYRDEEYEIRVRKQTGEDQDISGDYNQYDMCTEKTIDGGKITYYHNSGNSAVKQLISYSGYSWSLVALNGYGDNLDWDFAGEVIQD